MRMLQEFLLILLTSLLNVTDSSSNWRCLMNAEDRIFPELQLDRNFSLWQDSLCGMTYIYPVLNNESGFNCNGKVQSISFCYRYSAKQNISRSLIFTLYLLAFEGAEMYTVEIHSSPQELVNSGMCSDDDQSIYCCDSKVVNDSHALYFPSRDFVIGISTPDLAEVRLQQFNDNSTSGLYRVPYSYVTNSSIPSVSMRNFNDRGTPEQSQVIQFRMGSLKYTNHTGSTLVNSMSLPILPSSSSSIPSVSPSSSSEYNLMATTPDVSSCHSSVSPSPITAIEESMKEQWRCGEASPFNMMSDGGSGEEATPVNMMDIDTEEATPVNMMDIETEYIFPYIELSNVFNSSFWQDSLPGMTYFYPVSSGQINCSGVVASVGFCYGVNSLNISNIHIFNLLILNHTGSSFQVLQSVAVNSTPSSCMTYYNISGSFYCCERKNLSTAIELPPKFEIGVYVPDSSEGILQQFHSYFYKSGYKSAINISFDTGSIFTLSDTVCLDIAMQVLLLFIDNVSLPYEAMTTILSNTQSIESTTKHVSSNIESTKSITANIIAPSSTVKTKLVKITADGLTTELTSSIRFSPYSSITPTKSIGPSAARLSTNPNTVSVSDIVSSMSTGSTMTEQQTSASTSVSDIVSSMSTGSTMTTQETPPSTNANTVVVVSVIAAVVVIILIVSIILFIIICFCRCKSKSGSMRSTSAISNAGFLESNNQNSYIELQRHEYADIGPQIRTLDDNGKEDINTKEAYYHTLDQDVSSQNTAEHEAVYITPAGDMDALYAQLENIFIDAVRKENISLKDLIGSGQFGDVFEGDWTRSEDKVEVAVKTLKKGSDEDSKVKFLQEAAIMGQFNHPNVVTMHGVITDGEPVMLVLEMLRKGDLRHYLVSMKTDDGGVSPDLDGHELLSYCRQVASGMVYLSNKAFVHRDLAARNILVSDDRICKIADFGMARDLVDENYYISNGGMIPVKWTAPEAIGYKKYCMGSDVWSFGIVMYEIWSIGTGPYAGVDNNKVLQMIESGYRLPPPPGCPRAVYNIMILCWNPRVDERPNFIEVSTLLSVSNSKLLRWSEEDKAEFPDAVNLGSDLSTSRKLYWELQMKYKRVLESGTNRD